MQNGTGKVTDMLGFMGLLKVWLLLLCVVSPFFGLLGPLFPQALDLSCPYYPTDF